MRIKHSISFFVNLTLAWVLSTALLLPQQADAHEVLPTIADMEVQDGVLRFDMRLIPETFIAGIDLASVTDTNDAPQALEYDSLRALPPEEIAAEFETFWQVMARNINVIVDGERQELTLASVQVEPSDDFEQPRFAQVGFTATLPDGAAQAEVSWTPQYGALVLRQNGVPDPYDGYLAGGMSTGPIDLTGGNAVGGWQTFINYIPVGFDHIVPKGLDHILFVLGLFFLSTRMKPLIWQISAFTLAHTITLALAALGWVNIPASIVEPLIALSIAYVAIENLFTDGLSRWRPALIFGFGLLHGLGFASVLAEFGLPDQSFIPALIGFNIGVEIGQLAVIAVAYLCVFKAIDNAVAGDADRPLAIAYLVAMVIVILLLIPMSQLAAFEDLLPLVAVVAVLLGLCAASSSVPRFEGYREIVAMPASILIAVVAVYWCVERVFL